MAMDLFRENFNRYQEVWHKVLNIILDMIRMERIGQAVDELFLQSNIRMLMDLNLYHSAFEQQLLIQTQQFYDQEGDRLLESINIFDYLEHVSTRVHQESILRVKSYFDKSTKSQLQSIVEKELLTKRVENILTKCKLSSRIYTWHVLIMQQALTIFKASITFKTAITTSFRCCIDCCKKWINSRSVLNTLRPTSKPKALLFFVTRQTSKTR